MVILLQVIKSWRYICKYCLIHHVLRQIIAYNAEIQCVRQRFDNKKLLLFPEFEFATKIQIILVTCDNFSNFFDVPNIQKPDQVWFQLV
jgi:hypothetical protein